MDGEDVVSCKTTVNELAERFDMSLTAIFRGLKVLECEELMGRSRDAQTCQRHLRSHHIRQATMWWSELA